MKIVVLDGYTLNPGDLDWKQLEDLGDVKIYERSEENEIVSRIENAEIVITNKTPIRKETMEKCKTLKYITVLATGYDVIDLDAAKEHGIKVSNVPSYGPYSVSQFAISLLLEICFQVGLHNQSVHNGEWTNNADWTYWKTPLIELLDKTIGIIGFGRIGQTTAKIAQAMGMKVLANDKYINPNVGDVEYVSFDELCKRSDVIVLHCSLNQDNYGFINKESIKRMKKGAILINNARGQLVNEQDLANSLNSGHLFAAGIDVVSKEPIDKSNPLLTAKNCFITPHMSWGSIEARKRIMQVTCENIMAYQKGELINRVC